MFRPILYNDEVFKDINIEGILPVYSVSNYGTVKNRVTGNYISLCRTKDGYDRVSLRTVDGNSKHFLVHRLAMMTFHPVSNQDELEVNHLYGRKSDNRDTELEWVTPIENVRHAYATGLNNNIRENHTKALLTNDQVHFICKGLSEGVDFEVIKAELGDTSIKDMNRTIRSIKDGEAWVTISKDYVFEDYPNKRNLFTDDEVIIICQLLESDAGYKDILMRLGFDIYSMTVTELQNMCDIIGDIRNGNRYRHISKNFNIGYTDKMRYDQIFSFEEIHFICKCLEDKNTTPEILGKLGIYKNNVTDKEYEQRRHFISRLKTRKIFRSISDNYNF